ncbi:MAG: Ty1/Copia family ribonuclease HI [Myxococcota bacterium]
MILEMRYVLHSLGVNIQGPGLLFGDNRSVVVNTTFPSSTLKKKHNAIAFHKVRETIAAGIMSFIHIPGTINPADLLTKPLGPHIHRKLVHPLLRGNPREITGCGEYQRGVHPAWVEVTAEIRSGAEEGTPSNVPKHATKHEGKLYTARGRGRS